VFVDCSKLANVTIPGSLGSEAFTGCTSLVSVTIPNSVTNIGVEAFAACASLTSVFFEGDAPSVNPSAFSSDNGVTAYYLPETTGWTAFSTETGVQAVLWNPMPIVQANGTNFGVRSNQFWINVTGTANISIVVEACTNLNNPAWTPLQTLNFTNRSCYFSEPFQAKNSGRFYRISSP
jgi:hypothetical protein